MYRNSKCNEIEYWGVTTQEIIKIYLNRKGKTGS